MAEPSSDITISNFDAPSDTITDSGPVATLSPAATASPTTQTAQTVEIISSLVTPPGTTSTSSGVELSGDTTTSGPVAITPPATTMPPTIPRVESKASPSRRAIISGVLGGVGSVLILLVICYCCVCWRKKLSHTNADANNLETPTPYVDSPAFSSPEFSGDMDHSSTSLIDRRQKSSLSSSKTPNVQRERESSSTLSLREQPRNSIPSHNDITLIRRQVSFVPIDRNVTHSSGDETRNPHAQETRGFQELHQQFINLAAELGEGAYDVTNHHDARGGDMHRTNIQEAINSSQLREQLLMIQGQIANLEARQSIPAAASEQQSQSLAEPPEYSS